MATEDGRLGRFATVRESRLSLWRLIREQDPNGDAEWARSRVIDLDPLIPLNTLSAKPKAAGFADNGAGGVVFVWTAAGFFTIDLKSSRANKVGDSHGGFNHPVVPYMSFCTPGTDLLFDLSFFFFQFLVRVIF